MVTGTRPRSSAATKEAIKAAARERFAVDGYEKATIRAIAADARIDPAQVMRYFGNKASLFAAVADFDLHAPDLTDTPAPARGQALAAHFVRRWEEDETFTALLRASVTNETAAQRLRTIIATQVHDAVTRAGLPHPDPRSSATRVAMIASQVLGVAFCRYVLHLDTLADMSAHELTERLGATIQNYLTT